MNPTFKHSTYFVSTLSANGERPDIGPQFKYLKDSEVEYCKQKIAVRIVQLNYRRDKIITQIQDTRATTGYAKRCLQVRGDKLSSEIRTLETKFDELSTPNFPICKLALKTRLNRFTLPEGVTVFLAKFGKVAPEASTPLEPDLLAEATGGISPIPRVTEEIKWRPAAEDDANASIFDRVDEFIELPVEEIIRHLIDERQNGTPDLRNRARFLDQLWRRDISPDFDWNNYSADLSNASGVANTVIKWDIDDDTLSTFNLDLVFQEQDDTMALTQAAIDQLEIASQNNTNALVIGMSTLAAQRKLENIPIFSGESNCPLVIEEWFKIAERTARLAGWTDQQKLLFFQEKLTKSAANFNDSLTANQRAAYDAWKALMINGLHDNTTKAIKKGELKDLKQEPGERVRDFQTRIDDMYRIAYGAGPATSNDANVILVRDDMKKEILLAGLRREIATLVWNRVEADATYDETVDTAIACEKITEVKKIAQSKDITSAVSVISQENVKNTEKIKELEGLIQKLSTKPVPPPTASTPVDLGDPAVIAAFNTYNNAQTNFPKNVRFPDNGRSRSVSPFTYNRPNRPETTPAVQSSLRYNNDRDPRITCYNCGKKGHISRECWSGRGQQQQNRQRDGQRFSRDGRPNSERAGQNWRQNGSQQNHFRAPSNERFDRNNNVYGRQFNQDRGQNGNRHSQDYRNAPPNVRRQ